MIAHLRGQVLEPGVVETRDGVGYAVTTSTELEAGQEVSLRIVTTVRETDISLWGFAERSEELVFRALKEVSGVGPSVAMAVVRTLGAAMLVAAVESEDAGAFKPVPGVGGATAKRIISTIKLPEGVTAAPRRAPSEVLAGVAKTLQALGYPGDLAASAAAEVSESHPDASQGELVSLATTALAQQAGGN